MKKTLVLGASPNPSRYSFLAVRSLLRNGRDVVALGVKSGEIDGVPILKGKPDLYDIDTVTLYLNPSRQEEYYDYILGLEPNRIIFNPGTVNPVFMNMAESKGVEVVAACTLVMLSTGQY